VREAQAVGTEAQHVSGTAVNVGVAEQDVVVVELGLRVDVAIVARVVEEGRVELVMVAALEAVTEADASVDELEVSDVEELAMSGTDELVGAREVDVSETDELAAAREVDVSDIIDEAEDDETASTA
jgi:hypothetical protein